MFQFGLIQHPNHYVYSRAAGVEQDIQRYMKKYNERQLLFQEKEELRRKNVELQDAQIALQVALSGTGDNNDEAK